MKLNLFGKNARDLGSVETSTGKITLLMLFVPIFIEFFLRSMMGTVNTFILSTYSDNAVASVGVASQLVTMIGNLFMIISTGTTVVISQNLGAGNRRTAADIVTVAIGLTVVFATALGVTGAVFAEPIMRAMNLEEHLIADAVAYFRVASSLVVFQCITSVMMAVARSYGQAKAAMVVSLIMNACNALGGYIVVFRPFETPLHGAQGIATMRVTAEFIAFVVMAVLLSKMNLGLRLRVRKPFKLLRSILYIAVPGGIGDFSYDLSQTVSTAIIGIIGAAALSGIVYLNNIFVYVHMVSMTLSSVTTIMIGHLIGAGEYERARRMSTRNLIVAVGTNVFFSCVLMLCRYQVIGLFTSDSEIIAICTQIMLMDVFVEIGRAFNHVNKSSLDASADVKVPMLIGLGTGWTFSILLSYILGIHMGLGLLGCWIAFALEELARGLLLFWRWRTGRWRKSARALLQGSAPAEAACEPSES